MLNVSKWQKDTIDCRNTFVEPGQQVPNLCGYSLLRLVPHICKNHNVSLVKDLGGKSKKIKWAKSFMRLTKTIQVINHIKASVFQSLIYTRIPKGSFKRISLIQWIEVRWRLCISSKSSLDVYAAVKRRP